MILNHRNVKESKWYQLQELSTSKYVYFLTLLRFSLFRLLFVLAPAHYTQYRLSLETVESKE